jgi:DNA recombination-dependent growth factor C
MTARRYVVPGALPAGWREKWREQLDAMAFREAVGNAAGAAASGGTQGKEELEGWVLSQNLLDTDFSNFDRWLFDRFAVFALRVDKKSLPANLVKATVEKRCRAWCEEKGVERCPASVKKELREKLEEEWLKRTLPRVALTEVVWNVTEGWVLVGTLSEKTNERVRKRFHRTFGLELQPWSPLDWVERADTRDGLLATAPFAVGDAA